MEAFSNLFYRLIALGKVAKHNFPISGVIPDEAGAGDFFYLIGLVGGILLWGFAVVWFIIAIIMIATAYPFPFNMGWWGFVFPIGESRPAILEVYSSGSANETNRSVHTFNDIDRRRV
jgi:hypothetical protein